MFAAGRPEIPELQQPAALFGKPLHQFGRGHMVRSEGCRVAAEIADRLEMDAAHLGLPVQPELHQLPELLGIDPSHHGRHQNDAQPGLGETGDGLLFFGQQSPAAQRGEDLIADPVELEKDRGKAFALQPSGELGIAGKGHIKPHRTRLQQADKQGHDVEYNFKDPEQPLQLVFVCAMWLTGFDASTVSTLYLDKPMKDHSLMQTIARANRVTSFRINGEAKINGEILDRDTGRLVAVFQYLRGVIESIIDRQDIDAVSLRIGELLDDG